MSMNRISVEFWVDDNEARPRSVFLYSHHGGLAFLELAKEYAKELGSRPVKTFTPLTCFDLGFVMADFIRWLCVKMELSSVETEFYLGRDYYDGDSSDLGHWRINLIDAKAERVWHEHERPD